MISSLQAAFSALPLISSLDPADSCQPAEVAFGGLCFLLEPKGAGGISLLCAAFPRPQPVFLAHG